MFKYLRNVGVALFAALALLAVSLPAPAQVVTSLPVFVDNSPTVTDLGNGPIEIRVMTGSAALFTSSDTGVGSTSGSSTLLTLTSTAAAKPPCVGCAISGTGITAGTTIISFNGTTGIGLSAAMTVASGTAVAWGKACPSAVGSNRVMQVQAGNASSDLPLYTYARICGSGQFGPGAVIVPFAIGAH